MRVLAAGLGVLLATVLPTRFALVPTGAAALFGVTIRIGAYYTRTIRSVLKESVDAVVLYTAAYALVYYIPPKSPETQAVVITLAAGCSVLDCVYTVAIRQRYISASRPRPRKADPPPLSESSSVRGGAAAAAAGGGADSAADDDDEAFVFEPPFGGATEPAAPAVGSAIDASVM